MILESLPETLILASSSRYRKELLQRFGIPFDCLSPSVDESPLPNESPVELVSRLALLKATAIAAAHPAAIVIGSDQVAVFEGRILGKPLNHQAAYDQLSTFSGQSVDFLTAVCVLCQDSGFEEQYTDRTSVQFRQLEAGDIERYLRKEEPYDCAGSFKSEALGITLFERIENEDPSALIGLPLIRTAAMLRRAGLRLP